MAPCGGGLGRRVSKSLRLSALLCGAIGSPLLKPIPRGRGANELACQQGLGISAEASTVVGCRDQIVPVTLQIQIPFQIFAAKSAHVVRDVRISTDALAHLLDGVFHDVEEKLGPVGEWLCSALL